MPNNEDNEVTEEEIEKEKRKVKKLMPPEKRINEQKALHRAKELEKEHPPTAKEEVKEMKEFMEESESARKLLKPAWYLKKVKKKKK